MRKADLVSKIATTLKQENSHLERVDVLVVLEKFFKEVKECLVSGENLYVRGFGSFVAKKRARKVGRNIKKNKAIEIPAHYIPAFKPAKVFMEEVKKKLVVNEAKAAKTTKTAVK